MVLVWRCGWGEAEVVVNRERARGRRDVRCMVLREKGVVWLGVCRFLMQVEQGREIWLVRLDGLLGLWSMGNEL